MLISLLILCCVLCIGVLIIKNTKSKDISDQELERYLTYIPDNRVSKSAYTKKTTNDKNNYELMLGSALNVVFEKTTKDKFSKNEVDNVLKDMYNVTTNDINLIENKTDYITGNSGICYLYYDDEFHSTGCGASNYEKISLVEDYDIENNELIIYEYAITFWTYYKEEGYFIGDYKLLQNFDGASGELNLIKLSSKTNQEAEKEAKEYLKNNKKQFTKYKHTFKANNSNYYWYKTEIVENN